ncbi:MAG: hypothetical protein RLY72_2347, partial [Planctomycetota bacterium]
MGVKTLVSKIGGTRMIVFTKSDKECANTLYQDMA